MTDPQRPSMPRTGPSTGSAIQVRVSIAPESTTQVRPSQEVEAVPVLLRSVRETAIELVGPLFLPRQCKVLVSWITPDDQPQDLLGAEPRQEVHGVVQKVQMLTPTPDYALWVQLEEASPQMLKRLSDKVGG